MREQIRLNGIVRGEGRESTCTISATRVHLPGASGASETTNWSISKVSEALPDGDYDIFADGKCEHVRLVNGQWLSCGF
jgi:hypothetical protein